MLLTKYKIQESVSSTRLSKEQVEAHMRLMHLTPEPYIATFAVVMTEVLKDKIIDELGRI